MSAARRLRGRIFLFVGVLDVLYVANCLTPFVGLKFESSQAMYSDLDPQATNHLVLPPVHLFTRDTYVRDVALEAPRELDAEAAGLQWFLAWTRRTGHAVHLGFLTYHVERLCGAARGGAVHVHYADDTGVRHDVADACHEPSLARQVPLGLYPACRPACYTELEIWASGRWRTEPEAAER